MPIYIENASEPQDLVASLTISRKDDVAKKLEWNYELVVDDKKVLKFSSLGTDLNLHDQTYKCCGQLQNRYAQACSRRAVKRTGAKEGLKYY